MNIQITRYHNLYIRTYTKFFNKSKNSCHE